MSTDSMTLNKLLILYMLDKVDFPLTNSQISEFILGKGYASYFTLQEAFNDLADTELIQTETQYSSSFYTLTKSGEETLSDFIGRIPDTIREEIDRFLSEHSYHMRNENEYTADYFRDGTNRYIVTCSVHSRRDMLSKIVMNVPDEETAQTVCDNWKKNYEDIYVYLAQKLLSK